LALVIVRGGVLGGLVVSFFIQFANGGSGSTIDRCNDWFGLNAGLAVILVNAIFLAVDLICIVLLMQLFSFHVRLRHGGITTYTYIVRDGQRRRDAERKKMEIQRRRLSAIQKADSEGKYIQKFLLRAGGCHYVGEVVCKPCDPLRRDEEEVKDNDESKKQQNIIENEGTHDDGHCGHDFGHGGVSDVEKGDLNTVQDVNEENLEKDEREIENPAPLQLAMEERKRNQQRFDEMNNNETSSQEEEVEIGGVTQSNRDQESNVEFVSASS